MTQELVWNHDGQASRRRDEVDVTGELLDQVRQHAVRLLSEVGPRPRHLRVAAGDISVELDWDTPPSTTAPAENTVPPAEGVPDDAVYLTAPTVGVFYEAPEPGADPFVRVGDRVTVGQQVGIVEAMKLMIPVEADHAGTVVEALVVNGQNVEYGERLFALAADSE